MDKFIYCFSHEDKEKLLSNGYELLTEQKNHNIEIYVFENNNKFSFDLGSVDISFGNKLTF